MTDFAVIKIGGAEPVVDIKRVLVPVPGPPGPVGGAIPELTQAQVENESSTVFGSVSGMRLFQSILSFISSARAYVSKGSSEPTFQNGTVTGTYAFDYDDGNMHAVTFTAVDADLSWDNLPATLSRGSVGLITTTGATLPSTLGTGQGDWQVKLLANLVENSIQDWELWVDDGSTIKINEVISL